MTKIKKKKKKMQTQTQKPSIHKQTRLEVNRMKLLIQENAKEEHVAWKSPTENALKEFDNVLYGASLILLESIKEDGKLTVFDVWTMLEMDINRAGEMVETYNILKVNKINDQKEMRRFVEPTMAYFHGVATQNHLREIEGNPDFESAFLVKEAKSILADWIKNAPAT